MGNPGASASGFSFWATEGPSARRESYHRLAGRRGAGLALLPGPCFSAGEGLSACTSGSSSRGAGPVPDGEGAGSASLALGTGSSRAGGGLPVAAAAPESGGGAGLLPRTMRMPAPTASTTEAVAITMGRLMDEACFEPVRRGAGGWPLPRGKARWLPRDGVAMRRREPGTRRTASGGKPEPIPVAPKFYSRIHE